MSEETKAASPEGNGAAIDPTAVALALTGASREKADAFLDDQRSLIAAQLLHLHEDVKQIDLRIWELRLGVLLRLATLVVGLAVAGALSLMVWDAAHANGLIVDEFTVPPDLEARGLTGKVVAGELLSDLLSLQARSNSVRAASSYANNWGNNLRVEIPETGISIGELARFLREWLGHETHVSGAVIRGATGVTIAASAGSDAFPALTGAESDLDGLVQDMADAIHSRTQPYRHAIFLYTGTGQLDEAEAALLALAANGAPEDRYWANNGLVSLYGTENRWDDATNAARTALALRPGAFVPNFFLTRASKSAQRDEASLAAARVALAGAGDPDVNEQGRAIMRVESECEMARLQGDLLNSMALCNRARQLPNAVSVHQEALTTNLVSAAALHDPAAAYAVTTALRISVGSNDTAAFAAFTAWNELNLGRWSPALIRQASGDDMGRQARVRSGSRTQDAFVNPRLIQPAIAHAMALSGNFKGAHAIIDGTPLDCNLCVRTRARIAALEKNWAGAARWFERAAQDAPSTPFPDSEWGTMLLAKGDADAAIEKFKLANQKGPHFADPLEGWGEALMAKNQSHLALEKFAQAEKYAPNWGRLHLKWGEALAYAGKKDEAKAQFARAAALDLTPSEKSELAKVFHV